MKFARSPSRLCALRLATAVDAAASSRAASAAACGNWPGSQMVGLPGETIAYLGPAIDGVDELDGQAVAAVDDAASDLVTFGHWDSLSG